MNVNITILRSRQPICIDRNDATLVEPTEIFTLLQASYDKWGTGSIIVEYDGGRRVAVASNHQDAAPLYIQLDGTTNSLRVTDVLADITDISSLSKAACMRFLSYPFSCGPFEVNVWKESFHRDWMRVAPGFILYVDHDTDPHLKPLTIEAPPVFTGDVRTLKKKARFDFQRNIAKMLQQGRVAVEFSGGIDSGLVFRYCQETLGDNFLGGVTYDFTYREFARERQFREAICGENVHLVHRVRQECGLPFFNFAQTPYFDEPTVNATSWAMFDNTIRCAKALGAKTLLNGHGGDLVFLLEPGRSIIPSPNASAPTWMPPAVLRTLQDHASEVIAHLNRHSAIGIGGYWHPSMLHPAGLTKYAATYHPDISYRSGIISKDFYGDCYNLWNVFQEDKQSVQKPFAYWLFGDKLPEQVWRRSAKVNHLGNLFRGIARSRDEIVDVFDNNHIFAEFLGFSGQALGSYIRGFVNGLDSGNPMASQLIALFLWWDRRLQRH